MRTMMESIGILGGTGPAGRGVAVRLACAGYNVVLGSRDAQRASETASGITVRGDGKISGGTNEDAASCDIVIVATPSDSAVETAASLKSKLDGKIVVSMVNALTRGNKELIPVYPPLGSMAAEIAAVLTDSKIVGAFHHLPAAQMEDLDSGIDADVVIFGDDEDARKRINDIVSEMPGLFAIIAGTMALASAVEAFTAVCISINIRHRAHSYVKMAGLNH
jgi:8-hydroxy-5-deazaflavin:NADPH oxidoreductase